MQRPIRDKTPDRIDPILALQRFPTVIFPDNKLFILTFLSKFLPSRLRNIAPKAFAEYRREPSQVPCPRPR